MERKLFLSEDLGEDIVMDDGKVVADEDQILTNLLTATIKGEWDAVELYNSILGSIDDEEAIKVLNEIVSEEYVHIGKCQHRLHHKELETVHQYRKGRYAQPLCLPGGEG